MTKEEIKEVVREKLQTKRIIIFCAGEIAEEFYNESVVHNLGRIKDASVSGRK